MRAVWIALYIVSVANPSLAFSQASFREFENRYQADTTIHSIVELSTEETALECATFCTMQGAPFRELECGGFYVEEDNKRCHLIPKSYKNVLSDFSGITYYSK